MLDIVIPMAGEGRRFREAGYTVPKPQIPIHGKTMIERVRDCLTPTCAHRFVYLTREQVGETRGAVDTILRGRDWIDPANPVLLANCDQYITCSIDDFLDETSDNAVYLMVFNSTNPHHSYVRGHLGDRVTAIAEKQVISDNAVLGIYWFRSGQLLLDYAQKVLDEQAAHNGEFYVSAIIDLLIRDDYKVSAYEVDVHEKHILGTPEELTIFLDKVESGRVKL